LPGTYVFTEQNLYASAQGSQNLPVIVRAQVPGSVKIELSHEGFRVSGAFWTFENLYIRGVCVKHEDCDHAFHVVGKARNFKSINNTLLDFNAHFKVNMEDGHAPDDGVIEYNTISNSSIRHTGNPVTTVDIVAVSGWRIHHNLVSDFIKENSDKVSYGIFVKGGGERNRIDHNIVICEHALLRQPGQRVGISLGGGGTGAKFCRDQACVTEQNEGKIDSNLVLSCSDDGIYLNQAARSQVSHNTLIASGGISLRFAKPMHSSRIIWSMAGYDCVKGLPCRPVIIWKPA